MKLHLIVVYEPSGNPERETHSLEKKNEKKKQEWQKI
jgi:hypothetical protein